MKKLLFGFSLVLLLAAGCNKTAQNSNTGTPNPTTTQQTNPTPTTQQSQKPAGQGRVYKSPQKGFQITLPETWKDVKISEGLDSQGNLYNVVFEVSTKDPDTGKAYPDFPLLTISEWPKSLWQEFQKEPGNKPTLITEKSDKVFIYFTYDKSNPDDIAFLEKIRPRDASGKLIDFEIPKVISTFKFTE
jgi:hypothetical protein